MTVTAGANGVADSAIGRVDNNVISSDESIRVLLKRRSEAVGVRDFAAPGAGAARRTALAAASVVYLQGAWHSATRGRRPEGLALAAVGSLARGDCGPLSDLDLVLLHDGRHDAASLAELAEALWYPLWNAGLRLDHSTRSLGECREVASADLAAAVGMLDLAVVAGDEVLVAGVRSAVARDWRAGARTRLPEVLDAVAERHRRFGDLPDLLEPDLKEARGGFRDMRLLRALAAAWLADRPHGAVDRAYSDLLDVRDALRVATGRARDRLVRNDHDAVAALLGHPDSDRLLVHVSQASRVLAHGLDSTMRRAAQSQRARTLRHGPRRPALTPIGGGLFVNDGEVVLGPRVKASSDPLLLMRAAEAASRVQMLLSPVTLDNLVANGAPMHLPWSPAAREAFGDLLASGPGLWAVWESLTLAGVTSQWIPQWDSVTSLPQHNPVHRHTVDRHLVQTVIEASAMLDRVRRPDALLLAALLHDLGKAGGGVDHARHGIAPARAWLTATGNDAVLVDLVARLVEHHLTLVELATHRDPDDPRTVDELLAAVDHDPDTLDLLAALTEADARAVAPGAWSPWRATLVADLVRRAHEQLSSMSFAEGNDAGRTDRTEEGVDAVPYSGADRAERVKATPHGCPRAPEHLVAEALATGAVVRVEDAGDAQVVSIVAPDRVGLFADCAGVLAAQGLSVRRATLATRDRVADDRWYVTSRNGARADAEGLARALRRLARGDRGPLAAVRRPHGAVAAPTALPDAAVQQVVTRALLLPDASEGATVLELRAPDRVGLLYAVGRCLVAENVSVRSAHVSTSCGQAVDTLYLTEPDGSRLAPSRVARVIAALMDAGDAPA